MTEKSVNQPPSAPAPSSTNWTNLFQQTKEKLAKVLWNLDGVSEGGRELVLKEILWEMQQFQEKVQESVAKWESDERIYKEENELLRSLLGTGAHELRARVLGLAQEIHGLRRDLIAAQEDAAAYRQKAGAYAESDEDLRRSLKEAQRRIDDMEAQATHEWQSQMTEFSREQGALQEQLGRLDEDLRGVQDLLASKSEELTREKQAELAALQTRLLNDMENALRQKEDLLWAEEEIFARGVAQKLRGELQSATGRLQLTLERFHLLDSVEGPQTKSWEQWWRLLKVGPDELRLGLRDVTQELHRAVETLEEYLALTHRRAPNRRDLNVTEIVRDQLAKRYAERMEKGVFEVLVPETLPTVWGDAELLGQILHALVDNGLEALPRAGGRVRIKTEKSPDEKELWIDVSDTGGGIPSGQRDRLFQPFSTTKAGHRGLNLARAKRYAEWHRGRLELVESGPEGSVFRLALPL